jgi:hypothetical protein
MLMSDIADIEIDVDAHLCACGPCCKGGGGEDRARQNGPYTRLGV